MRGGAMWSRIQVSRHLLRMSSQRQVLPPGIYLHIAQESTTASQKPFDITQNPWYHKYADKLNKLKQSDPAAYAEKIEKLRSMYEPATDTCNIVISEPTPDTCSSGSSVDPAAIDTETEQKIVNSMTSQTKPKTLDAIMKVSLLLDKTEEEIRTIWTEYHSHKQCVFAVIPGDDYDEMKRRLNEFPLFLYPLPRGEGYELFVQQTSFNSCHFTPLIMYQKYKENSPTCLTIDHYDDLREEKGIVLMKGEVDKDVISVHEAQLLALQLKIYYGVQSGLKFNLVRQFNNDPDNFSYMALIREFENYKKDSKEYQTDFKQS